MTGAMLKKWIVNLPAVPLGRILGRGLYIFDVHHRQIVRRNLEFAYPELERHQLGDLARRVFQNYGTTILETLQLGIMTRHDIERRIRLHGAGYLRDVSSQQRGFIVVSAHLGNWEIGLQALSCILNQPVTAVAKRFKNNRFERLLHGIRTRFGNTILYKKKSLAAMTQVLRYGGVLGILVDMARRKDGVDINFFGKKATATPAVAMLALRYRCPVIPMFCIRESDGGLDIYAEPAVAMRRSNDLRADLVENTQRITDVVERMIRQHPEQWQWLMKRWKEHYPYLYE
jgi:KDO2-lipid IV(A) lauroyltransferase